MKYLIFFFMSVLCFSCTKYFPSNNIRKIELAKSAGFIDRSWNISIDGNLNFYYYGFFESNKEKELYGGKINQRFWDTLNRKLKEINYKAVPKTDSVFVADASYFDLIIYEKKYKKEITRINSVQKDSIMSFLSWLGSSFKKVKLKKSSKPVRFEAHYPYPNVKDVKFPPKDSEN